MISVSKMKTIYTYASEHGDEDASEHFDVSVKTIKRYVQLYRRYVDDGISEKSDGSVVVNSDANPSMKNIVDVMDYGKLDPSQWKPHRIDYNQRADGKVQFKAAFLPVSDYSTQDVEDYASRFTEFVKDYTAPPHSRIVLPSNRTLATLSAADWHHGKQVWGKEISGGGDNWDIHESKTAFERYIAYTKERLSVYKPDTIVLELMGDWFNVDSPSNMTVAGTVQAEDSRFIKTQCYAETMLVDAIESLHEITNNVTLLIVPGNHDATRILLLGRFVQAYYRNDTTITVMCEPTTRKKIRWGNTLLGYSHELKGNVVQNMFSLWPTDCGECTDLIMNVGHLHSRKDMVPVLEYVQSVKVVQHPAMVPEDAWSSSEGYYHKREALVRVFDEKLGQIDEFMYRPKFME